MKKEKLAELVPNLVEKKKAIEEEFNKNVERLAKLQARQSELQGAYQALTTLEAETTPAKESEPEKVATT